jgi:hypothetical protein
MTNPYILRIEALEEELEAMRQRAEAFEQAFGPGAWDKPVAPLSLYQTRIMRIIAKGDVTGTDAVRLLACYYPSTSGNSFDALLVLIRRALPDAIAPNRRRSKYCVLTVPDRPALREFLETGILPEAGRLAA